MREAGKGDRKSEVSDSRYFALESWEHYMQVVRELIDMKVWNKGHVGQTGHQHSCSECSFKEIVQRERLQLLIVARLSRMIVIIVKHQCSDRNIASRV